MNWPYFHTLVNHFPIVLTVVGAAALAVALIAKTRALWLYALVTLTLAGVSAYPAFLTGDAAADALRGTWYVARSTVAEHDAAAGFALTSLLVLGAAAAYTWWRMARRDATGLPPAWQQTALTVITAFTLAIVVRTAYLGGRIIHESPRLAVPPAGVDTSAFTP